MFKRFMAVLIAAVLFVTIRAFAAPVMDSDKKADELLLKMSLREKIGQMTLVEKMYLDNPDDIMNYNLGALLSGGDSMPEEPTAEGWAKMVDGFQAIALKTRLAIPIFFGIDSVHGHAKIVNATIFPHNIGMGCTWDPKLIEKAAHITAVEMAATGITWNYAPCIAVVRDIRWGRTYESYGEQPDMVSKMGVSYIRGLQGKDLTAEDSVLATPKHFIADGGTEDGKNEGNALGTEQMLRKLYLPPYLAALSNGARVIMASFSSWNGIKMHANRELLTGLLKEELKFTGFICSDWGAVQRLPGEFPYQVQTAINAGIDMVMVPKDYKKFIDTLESLVRSGAVPQSRVDDAVKRILKVKFETGLFQRPFSNKKLLAKVGSEEHRKVARQCVRESAVLLKNANNILPLSKKLKKIIVAGSYIDSVDIQCGGWTVTWQGGSGKVQGGITLLNAIRKAVSPGTKVVYSPEGNDLPSDANVAIVATGENPYAETMGDRTDLVMDPFETDIVDKLVKKKIPVVMVMFSGRPLIVSGEIQKWNAFLAAWLPGPEAGGIADILFGDYNPTGKLSVSWPKDMGQFPVFLRDTEYKPLFKYGFGLRYSDRK